MGIGSSSASHPPPTANVDIEDLRDQCHEQGIDFPANATKQLLLNLLQHNNNTSMASRKPPPSYWKLATDSYEELVCAIIRPPRSNTYNVDTNLGKREFKIGGLPHERVDFELVNDRKLRLQCSWWRERGFSTLAPCCIYLHGNSSCRAEAVDVVKPLLQSGISVLAFDFSGSGLSDGEYVSLGYYETMDLKCVIAHLRGSNRVSTICLWGRSMGAVTALMLAESDPSISCMICDSPFSSLRTLARELVDTAQLNIPKFAVGLGMRMIRSSVRTRAKFDLNTLEVIQNVDKCFVPCLFACAQGDKFVRPQHAIAIHEAYAGDKNIVQFPGDHNSPRPKFFFDSALIFLQNAMMISPGVLVGGGDAPLEREERFVMPAPMRNGNVTRYEEEEDAEEEALLQQALLMSMQNL